LPTPRGPVKRKACAILPALMEFLRVVMMCG